MTLVKGLLILLQSRDPEANVLMMTQRKQPFENRLAGVVGREQMLDQRWRLEADVGADDVFLVVGPRIRAGSYSAWIVAEHEEAREQLADGMAGSPWMALLTKIAKTHIGIETLEERGNDMLDFHDIGVVGLRSALTAAYRTGIAAGMRHAVTSDGGRPEPGDDRALIASASDRRARMRGRRFGERSRGNHGQHAGPCPPHARGRARGAGHRRRDGRDRGRRRTPGSRIGAKGFTSPHQRGSAATCAFVPRSQIHRSRDSNLLCALGEPNEYAQHGAHSRTSHRHNWRCWSEAAVTSHCMVQRKGQSLCRRSRATRTQRRSLVFRPPGRADWRSRPR
jgi:hypothetical protein